MNKSFTILSLLLTIVLLNSCGTGGGRMILFNDYDKQADARFEQVVETIKKNDKEALIELFSTKALDETIELDENLDSLFKFIQGEIISWEKPNGPAVFESSNYGHTTKKVSSFYYVNTEKQNYYFLLEDFPVDTDNPNNVGLYLLLVVKAENEEKIYDRSQKVLFDDDKKITHAGIYIPFE